MICYEIITNQVDIVIFYGILVKVIGDARIRNRMVPWLQEE